VSLFGVTFVICGSGSDRAALATTVPDDPEKPAISSSSNLDGAAQAV